MGFVQLGKKARVMNRPAESPTNELKYLDPSRIGNREKDMVTSYLYCTSDGGIQPYEQNDDAIATCVPRL